MSLQFSHLDEIALMCGINVVRVESVALHPLDLPMPMTPSHIKNSYYLHLSPLFVVLIQKDVEEALMGSAELAVSLICGW